jgi:hypothetical protein
VQEHALELPPKNFRMRKSRGQNGGMGDEVLQKTPLLWYFFDEVEKIPQQTGLVLCTRENTYQR